MHIYRITPCRNHIFRSKYSRKIYAEDDATFKAWNMKMCFEFKWQSTSANNVFYLKYLYILISTYNTTTILNLTSLRTNSLGAWEMHTSIGFQIKEFLYFMQHYTLMFTFRILFNYIVLPCVLYHTFGSVKHDAIQI